MKHLILLASLAFLLTACIQTMPRDGDYPERAIPTQSPNPQEAGTPSLEDVEVREAEVIEADTTSERQGVPLPPTDDGR